MESLTAPSRERAKWRTKEATSEKNDAVATLEMNDGKTIPQLGLGVWQLSDEDTYTSVRAAIETGYRHIDTAAIYGNEEAVGRAVADAVKAGDVQRADNRDRGIVTEAWSPLGQEQNLTDPTIAKIAAEHGVSVAQAIIRWHIQRGDVVIPRSSKVERVRQNFDVFGFELSADEVSAIEALDVEDGRIGGDPLTFHAGLEG